MIRNTLKRKIKKYGLHVLAGAVALTGITVMVASYSAPSPAVAYEQPETYMAEESKEDASEPVQENNNPSPAEPEKKEILNGFVQDELGTRYYKNNVMFRNTKVTLGPNEVYAFDENGYIRTGWYCEEDGFHFYRPNGVEKQEWIFDGRNWYYIKNGELYTGWHQIVENALTGEMFWYCFDEGGRLYMNTETPDGKKVDEDGKLIEDKPRTTFEWDKDKSHIGTLSGLIIADMPAEFYMLSMAGETSGLQNIQAVSQGDRGRAYGVCQFDYRYDLVDFMNYAYNIHPDLWRGFEDYLYVSNGNPVLVYNDTIGNAFVRSMNEDFETSISDQLYYFRKLYWDGFKDTMNTYGFDLDNRHVAVQAAFFSVNVNCGAQPNIFIENLDPSMSDEEMIRGIYELRNTVFAEQNVGDHQKGTSTRYLSAEPRLALDLLYGYANIDSVINYGGGVEWGGNPFVKHLN